MPGPNTNYDALTAATINKRSSKAADNLSAHNAVLSFIEKSGNTQSFDGGTEIEEPILYGSNPNTGSYSGYDVIGTAASDELTLAKFTWAEYIANIVYSNREVLANSGKSKAVD